MTATPVTTEADELPLGYPTHWEADIVLRDGSVAHLRPIKPSDTEAIHEFHSKQSEESIYLRFFAPLKRLSDRDVYRFTHVDYIDRVALVVTLRGELIGIGRYDRIDRGSAEVAFNISDHYQGKGIGSVLLEHLAAIAQEFGITRFTAEVLPQNRKMLRVFSDAGYELSRRMEDGVIQVDFDIEPTDQSKAVALAREHRAEALSVGAILTPRVVAVIGASRDPDSVGHRILANIVARGFTGSVCPVNAKVDHLLGLPCHPRVGDIPEQVDLAVIAVPPRAVLKVVRECADAGVKALLVLTAGFADASAHGAATEGAELQSELLTLARTAGMRVIGPNSFGIINNTDPVRLNATLAPTLPAEGRFGLFAQSGALGIALLASAARRNLGISSFASAGNRVDVSGNDFMQFWIDDEQTSAVGLHLESMGNPRKFSRIARHLASRKPVIVIKATASGAASPGHRVRETRQGPQVFDAMLKQTGVIRVEDVHQLFDVAQLVLSQPLPEGKRVAIVSNSTALAALAVDACLSRGLRIGPEPRCVAPEAGVEEFRHALDEAFADPRTDSVVACFIPPVLTFDEDVADAVRRAAAHSDKPVVATFLGMRGVDGYSSVLGDSTEVGGEKREGIPVYSTPEDAVRALAAVTTYGRWRHKDRGTQVAPGGINRRVAEDIVHTALSVTPRGRRLAADETAALLQSYGIEVWRTLAVDTADEAVAAADELGYPVVLKTTNPEVRARGGVGGVRIDLAGPDAVRSAWHSLHEYLSRLDEPGLFVVQRMADSVGVPCVVASHEDPLFGPVVAFSVAGPPTELLDDIAYRVPPLTDVDVHKMVSSIKAWPLLDGYKGAPKVDRTALEELIARVSVLADDLPEVARLRLDPVNVHPGGVEVLGAVIELAPAPKRTDPGRRSLT